MRKGPKNKDFIFMCSFCWFIKKYFKVSSRSDERIEEKILISLIVVCCNAKRSSNKVFWCIFTLKYNKSTMRNAIRKKEDLKKFISFSKKMLTQCQNMNIMRLNIADTVSERREGYATRTCRFQKRRNHQSL